MVRLPPTGWPQRMHAQEHGAQSRVSLASDRPWATRDSHAAAIYNVGANATATTVSGGSRPSRSNVPANRVARRNDVRCDTRAPLPTGPCARIGCGSSRAHRQYQTTASDSTARWGISYARSLLPTKYQTWHYRSMRNASNLLSGERTAPALFGPALKDAEAHASGSSA